MINPILLENATATVRSTLPMAKIRALCGLPDDAKITIVPAVDGTGNFSLVAEWDGPLPTATTAPVNPAAPVAPEAPRRTRTKPPPVLVGPEPTTPPVADSAPATDDTP